MSFFTTFRLAAYETPLWAIENFSSGRYNDVGDGATQYLSLHPMTPWAELLRNERRRSAGGALQLRLPLWAIRIQLDPEPTEINFDNAEVYGLLPEALVADDQSACRGSAREFRSDPDGPRALIVPSAALPGTQNVVLLDPFVTISYVAEPVAPEDLPTCMAAQDGRCPDGLWDLVHHHHSFRLHAALEAWHDGASFEFVEPPTSVL